MTTTPTGARRASHRRRSGRNRRVVSVLSGLAMAATAGFAGGWAARGVSDQPSADAAVPAAAVASAAPALGTKGCPTPRAITSIKSNERVVALTFDDGPSAEVTGQILRTLADKKVKATFFMTGEHASAHPDLVAQIAAAGHAIGSHSWNHPRLDKLSPAQVTDQVERATNAVSVAAGTRVCLTRPPFGLTTPQVDALSAAMGLTTVGWTQNPRDWLNPTPEQLRRDSAPWSDRPATILLLHEHGAEDPQQVGPSATVAALPGIIDDYLAQGYRFVQVTGEPFGAGRPSL